MKIQSFLLLAQLVLVGSCGSSAAPPTDAVVDQTNEVVDSHAPDGAALDRPMEQPTRTCLEFPGCPKLIYDHTGCPVACDVGGLNTDAGSG